MMEQYHALMDGTKLMENAVVVSMVVVAMAVDALLLLATVFLEKIVKLGQIREAEVKAVVSFC